MRDLVDAGLVGCGIGRVRECGIWRECAIWWRGGIHRGMRDL